MSTGGIIRASLQALALVMYFDERTLYVGTAPKFRTSIPEITVYGESCAYTNRKVPQI